MSGSTEPSAAAGADVIIVADRAGAADWQGDEALLLLRRFQRTAEHAVVVCAGAEPREIIERGVRELHTLCTSRSCER